MMLSQATAKNTIKCYTLRPNTFAIAAAIRIKIPPSNFSSSLSLYPPIAVLLLSSLWLLWTAVRTNAEPKQEGTRKNVPYFASSAKYRERLSFFSAVGKEFTFFPVKRIRNWRGADGGYTRSYAGDYETGTPAREIKINARLLFIVGTRSIRLLLSERNSFFFASIIGKRVFFLLAGSLR